MVKDYLIGIDVGATKIKIGLIRGNKIIFKRVLSTPDFISEESLILGICKSINVILAVNRILKERVLGVGIGLPGPIDYERGIVRYLPNIKGWRNVRLRDIVRKKIGLPVFIDNDANLMALAESRIGAAKGKKNVVALTLGTGVGGGIIIDGFLYRGSSFAAGEIGHIPVNETGPKCNCGGAACLERYIGNRHILQEARKIFGADITLEKLSLLANKGNKRAANIWKNVAKYLGITLSGVVNFLNPDVIVIGGGVSEAGSIIFDNVRKALKERAMPTQAKTVKIAKAKLGNDAGMIGAALLARESLCK